MIDYSLRWIVPFVIGLHLTALIFLKEFSAELLPLPTKKIIAVKTVRLSPSVSETKSLPAEANKPNKKVTKEVKKPAPEIKKVHAPAKPAVERKNDLVALAKEKIGKIAPSSDKILKSSLEEIITPKAIEHFQSELSIKEHAYRDELASRLKLHLKLPEYGNVKIELRVEPSGKMVHFKILNYESALNAEYIEKNLPKVKFPSFKGSEIYEFTIVMSNE